MSEYTPDCWVIVKVSLKGGTPHYRVLASWFGGFTWGDSWKLSSGIEDIIDEGEILVMPQTSGSVYRLWKTSERLSGVSTGVFNNFAKQLKEGEIFEIVDIGEVKL